MQNLIISNLEIPFDENNRVRLNDIHKAVGGDSNKAPSEWMKNKKTQEYIAFLNSGNIPSLPVEVLEGRNGGTWAVEKACLDYAAWISPQAKDLVYDGFLAYHRGEVKPKPELPLLPPQVAEVAVRSSLAISEMLGVAKPMAKVIAVDLAHKESGLDLSANLVGNTVDREEIPVTATALGKMFTPALSARKLNPLLESLGYQEKDESDNWMETAKGKPFAHHEPYKSKSSDHCGYTLKWLPSLFKEIEPQILFDGE